jgi:hypothetical protein
MHPAHPTNLGDDQQHGCVMNMSQLTVQALFIQPNAVVLRPLAGLSPSKLRLEMRNVRILFLLLRRAWNRRP